MPTVTVKIKLPDYNRKAFTDLLIESKEIARMYTKTFLRKVHAHYSIYFSNLFCSSIRKFNCEFVLFIFWFLHFNYPNIY